MQYLFLNPLYAIFIVLSYDFLKKCMKQLKDNMV